MIPANADILSKASSHPCWGRYELLRPEEIEAILNAAPVAFIPWGALEFHGRHAPVGLDGLKAHGLCCAIAERTGGVVLPPVYHATSTIKTLSQLGHARHSIEHGEETVTALFRDIVTQLLEERFAVVMVLSGHIGQPHQSLLEREGAALAARHPSRRILVVSDTSLVTPEQLVPNHAGLGEISLLLHFAPETIDLARLPADHVPDLERDAVLGPDPRNATAAAGRALVEAIAAAGARRVTAALAEVHSRSSNPPSSQP
jgi:creatinine amidohydrolase